MLKLLSAYGYESGKQLFLSLCPSFKYGNAQTTFAISGICGIIAKVLGFSPLLALSMFLLLIVETITGIQASRTRGEHFESWKFSRLILKVGIWLVVFFVLHAFSTECGFYDGIVYMIASWAFDALHALALVFFCIENVTSILENVAVMDGKPKTAYIEAMQEIWQTLVERIKDSNHSKEE